jgi:hypothetical protein
VDLRLALEAHDALVVHLREHDTHAAVAVRPARVGARTLVGALRSAIGDGYGECFWPGSPGGQYWWIFRREAESLECVAMWTRGGASLWEHVFRATDSAEWIQQRLSEELERLGLDPGD